MWKVKETELIGVKTFWQVYKPLPRGGTVVRGRYEYRNEAERLADKLNREEGENERIQ